MFLHFFKWSAGVFRPVLAFYVFSVCSGVGFWCPVSGRMFYNIIGAGCPVWVFFWSVSVSVSCPPVSTRVHQNDHRQHTTIILKYNVLLSCFRLGGQVVRCSGRFWACLFARFWCRCRIGNGSKIE